MKWSATRVKNVLASGIKNILAFAFTTITFYLWLVGLLGVSHKFYLE